MAARLSRKIVITVALLLAGFAVLFSVGLKGSLVYYLTVSEYLDRSGREDLGENFRLNGNVLTGSIVKDPRAPGARFVVTDGTRTLPVVYAKETPDTFVDGAEVVVEGSMGPGGVFVAQTLLAKCPSKYEAQNRKTNNYKKPPGAAVPSSAPQGSVPASR
ncbi:MAG TPA: cytochrome c maturation protein CcmE [Candidatus Polarisedimenticolia bacterium]|nr:cytochrome c maturation protein CcmE [Candidatus Polarisedimenticolia bacterium]